MQENSRWHILETGDDVAQAVCQRILSAAQQAISQHGIFKLVLAGGGTPEKVYRLLSKTEADWGKWFIYYGDERCLSEEHKDRNSVMATRAFLAHVAIPESQVFTMPAEFGPKLAASFYQPIVADALPFDMVLLGMGEDGHTASLFPGHQHNTDDLTHAVYNSPKPPDERVSLSAKALSATQQLIFIITGANKQEAVKQWRAGQDLPVANIHPAGGIDVYMDNSVANRT
ncbi:6-phosphogluconolactonase [Crenothrix polyspora]|uniref:6-phosphogluconolactonase n=1 Tax=Crenothrix polyspora TaxID=360316 RepID=A0A1R4H9P7_9GAMM|nr:6-phosphogluconolactonase [Crenothrix polyspora]SJM92982.1 6-phosphogluconolactonase [Crenothrix polyspora]